MMVVYREPPPGRGPAAARRRATAACLALAAWAFALFAALPARAEQGARDIVVRFTGAFLDQTEKKTVVRVDLTLPMYEWTDRQGAVKLEPQVGTGKAVIRRLDGQDEEVTFSARLTRFSGPPEELPDGTRRWSLRGDLYMMAEGRELIETEFCPDVAVPPVGEKRSYPAPETWPEGEGASEAMGKAVLALVKEGRGGGVIHGRSFWARPAPQIPFFGMVSVVEIESRPASKGAAEREADRLLNRVQYVASDYARSVKDGQIINEAEYAEQINLLQEAELLADRLGVTDQARRLLGDVRNRVDWRSPPPDVAALCKKLEAELLATIGLLLGSPEPAALSAAAPLFREQCARCHGETGDGSGPSAKGLAPPPRDFLDPAESGGMTPHRAYMAITSGVPGTAMASFEAAIPAEERWALAFYALSLRHRGGGAQAVSNATPFSLDELTTSTDDDLRARAEQASPGAPPSAVVAYARSAEAVEAAAASPFEPIRRDLRAAASGEPEEASEALDRARSALSDLAPEVRLRDEAAARDAEMALAAVGDALSRGAGEADVRRAAWQAFPALRRAELALALPAPSRLGGTLLRGFGAAVSLALLALALRRTLRVRAVQPAGLGSTSGSPS